MHAVDQSIRFPGGRVGFLLIHGLGGTPMEMRYVAQGLARAGHTVHVPQLAGHCGSAEDLRATSWMDWYASVEEEHHRMGAHCQSVVVCGLSMGAILAIHHAAQYPREVSALGLYAPTLWLDGWGIPWYSGLFRSRHAEVVCGLLQVRGKGPLGHQGPARCGRSSSRRSRAATAPRRASPRSPAA